MSGHNNVPFMHLNVIKWNQVELCMKVQTKKHKLIFCWYGLFRFYGKDYEDMIFICMKKICGYQSNL